MSDQITTDQAPPAGGEMFASLYVHEVRTENFRGLGECTLEFEPDVTLLVGRNNAGKSRVLRAVAVALGAVPADRDDLTVGGPPTASIDLVLAPRPREGDDAFEDRVARRLGGAQAISDDPVRERFAWRTTIRQSQEGFGVRADHAVLVFDQTTQRWQQPGNPSALTADQRAIVVGDLVETRRDIVEELSRRGSPIRRILDDLEIEPERRSELEVGLQTLGSDIVASSASLAAVKQALQALTRSIDAMGVPTLQPLPVRLEELARSVSIDLDTGEGGLPMRLHGSGARSLTSLQVQGVLYDRRLGRDGPAVRPHPVSLIEEPEAHLHPQAQFEIPALLHAIQGQIIVSTHSSHLASVVEPRSIRLLQTTAGGTSVVDLRPTSEGDPARARRPSMHVEEMEKLRRLVERPFGELLFASAVILGDGATERALLPPLVRAALSDRAHGLCVVDPGSLGSDLAVAVVKFANLIGLPWLLFSDSDEQGTAAAERLVRDHGDDDASRIVWVRRERAEGAGAATERMLIDFDSDLCERACAALGFDAGPDDLLDFMQRKKGVVGRLLAMELLEHYPWAGPPASADCWPKAVNALIAELNRVLPERADGDA